MSKQEIKDLAVTIQNCMRQLKALDDEEQTKTMEVIIQNYIQELMSLVNKEQERLREILNKQVYDLMIQYDETKKRLYTLNNSKAYAERSICQQYGHVYKTSIYHRKVFTNRIGYVIRAEVLQECVCCGSIRHVTMMPAPQDGKVDPMPAEMQEAIKRQVTPINKKIADLIHDLTDIEHKKREIQDRYYEDICKVYGHSHVLNQDGVFICPCCGKRVDEPPTNFLDYLDRLANLDN